MVTHWLAELDGRRATVEVPATSANLGAGFDCLAVALALTNKFHEAAVCAKIFFIGL